MRELILHHYPQSPVAEKVRKVLGLKNLAWRSVRIPRIPPKPDLVPLTGGYRLTPVLQVGADIYCDSQCIVREIERRHPTPTLFPGQDYGTAWATSRWADGAMFRSAIAVVLGAQAATLPEDFAADRGRLYFGASYDYEAMRRDLPHELGQIRAQLGWIEDHLEAGRRYLVGDAPGLPDAYVYYLVWFLRGRYEHGPALIDSFPHLAAWEARVGALGHGHPTELDSREALEIAAAAVPEGIGDMDASDPQPLDAGQRVLVSSIADDGTDAVPGTLVTLARDEIVLRHEAPEVGEVAIHFPRVGYRVQNAADERLPA